jgi:hypothetical protein
MIKAPRNTMASAPRWQTESIAPHVHDWVTVGTDGRGEVYRVCTICDARSNAPHSRRDALRQAWLEYEEDWDDSAEPAPPAPLAAVAASPVVEEGDFDTDEPVRRGPGRPRKY